MKTAPHWTSALTATVGDLSMSGSAGEWCLQGFVRIESVSILTVRLMIVVNIK